MLVILSDVHLTDGTSGTTIVPRAFKKFGDILTDIIGDPKKAKINKIDIVLLGDIFDVIRSSLWLRNGNQSRNRPIRPWSDPGETDDLGWNVERYTKEIVKAIINHPNNIKARDYLRQCKDDWAAKDVEVNFTYLMGNHDWLINRYDSTRLDIANFIGLPHPRWYSANPFPEIHLFEEYGVLARHGDYYDRFNHEGDRNASSLGDAIVIDLLNRFPEEVRQKLGLEADDKLYKALKEIDNVRPILQAPAWIQGVCNYYSGMETGMETKIHRVWNDSVDRFFALDFVKQHDQWGPDITDALEMALRLTSSFSFERLQRILGNWVARGIYQNLDDYRRFAYNEWAIKKNLARYVVYGHTHKAEQIPMDTVSIPGPPEEMVEKVYFNSGTWRKVFEPTAFDAENCEFIGWHVMTFLVFYLPEEREANRHFEMWSASLG
jgi:UDP-2,3-diacylglucosamine pyrophosphatase LpxH